MLAIETGWTPTIIAELPVQFVAACRWALYARAVAGDGLPSGEVPQGASPEIVRASLRVRQEVERIRAVLYPEGD